VLDLPTEQPKILPPRNLRYGGALEKMCGTWCGATLKINFTVLLLMCNKSLYVIFSGFHLNGPSLCAAADIASFVH
jgi:hypothetical protein